MISFPIVFLRELILKNHTEHSHASFMSDKTSGVFKIMRTIATCKKCRCYFCSVFFLEDIILKDHTEHSYATFVSDKISEVLQIVSTIATCKKTLDVILIFVRYFF